MPRILIPNEIPDHQQRWLWEHWVPIGDITIVQGADGTGKSTLVCDLVARATSARPMPRVRMPVAPAPPQAPQSPTPLTVVQPRRRVILRRPEPDLQSQSGDAFAVVYITLEEPASRVKKRLALMGANLALVRIIDNDTSGSTEHEAPFDVERDVGLIETAMDDIVRVTGVQPVGWIIGIDTLLRAMHCNARSYQQTERALRPLRQLLHHRGGLGLANNHLDKQGRSGLGSAGFRALTR